MASAQPASWRRVSSASVSTGVWLTTSSSCLWLHTSCSSGATLRSPTRIAGAPVGLWRPPHSRISSQELQLVGEFLVHVRVRDIAARRDIEIMDGDAGRRSRFAAQRHRDVPRIGAIAHLHHARFRERETREDGDAVIALLAHMHDERIAKGLQLLQRKPVVGALGLLQAQDVGPALLQEALHLVDPQADGVDVPSRDCELHGEHPEESALRATTVSPKT